MTIKTLGAPCWVVVREDGADHDGEPQEFHWKGPDDPDGLDDVRDYDRRNDKTEGPVRHKLAPLDNACSTLTCDGCGYRFDEDGDGVCHGSVENLESSTIGNGEYEAEGWTKVGDQHFCPVDECQFEAERLARAGGPESEPEG